jgi:hypothetical protein
MFMHAKMALGAAAFGALLSISSIASAAVCTSAGFGGTDISGRVVTNSGCEVGTTNNDSTTQVNLDTMNGFSDWSLVSALGEPSNTLSGSWDLGANFFDTYDRALLVFKDGEGVPANYVGYLILEANGTSGTWTTPFANATNGVPKDVSHINVYGHRCDGLCPDPGPGPSPVPLPAPFLLLGLALGGLGAARWLKNRRTVQTA